MKLNAISLVWLALIVICNSAESPEYQDPLVEAGF